MNFRESLPEMEKLCVDRLGEHAGPSLAAMARPAFRLDKIGDGGTATGHCHLGGAALLGPGTTWPECEDIPLSLLAVLDTGPLTDWLGDELPCRPGLLNFFFLDPDLGYDEWRHIDSANPQTWRVIPADPAHARETAAPAPARSFAMTPLHATPVPTIPKQWDDHAIDRLDFGPGREHDDSYDKWRAFSSSYIEYDGWAERYGEWTFQAFGWPELLQGSVLGEGDTHLLQIDGFDRWMYGDAGILYYTIPTQALRSGDFTQVVAGGQSC